MSDSNSVKKQYPYFFFKNLTAILMPREKYRKRNQEYIRDQDDEHRNQQVPFLFRVAIPFTFIFSVNLAIFFINDENMVKDKGRQEVNRCCKECCPGF